MKRVKDARGKEQKEAGGQEADLEKMLQRSSGTSESQGPRGGGAPGPLAPRSLSAFQTEDQLQI